MEEETRLLIIWSDIHIAELRAMEAHKSVSHPVSVEQGE